MKGDGPWRKPHIYSKWSKAKLLKKNRSIEKTGLIARLSIFQNEKREKMAEFNMNTESWCSCCNRSKPNQQFLVSLNPSHPKYLPICKSCISMKLRQYGEKTHSDEAALYGVCLEMGYPMIKEYYLKALTAFKNKEKGTGNNLFLVYHAMLKEAKFEIEGFWQSDMELSDFIETNKEGEVKLAQREDYAEQERLWGKFDPAEYDLLNDFFEMYTQDVDDMTPAMEMRYRDLCKAELRKRKADEKGDRAEIKEAENSIKNNMSMLKLDNFEAKKSSDIEKHIERMCWEVENTKPCECRDLDKYKDFSNFGIKWEEILRCVRNAVSGTREYPDLPKEGEVT